MTANRIKKIKATSYTIFAGIDSLKELKAFLESKNYRPDQVFILTDKAIAKYCLPVFMKGTALKINSSNVITLEAGEHNKQLKTCEHIWKQLTKRQADRTSLLVNLGGGVITDMGGFAAATYKRGIDFIHVPTSLLAMVDAAVGGKTGVDFEGFKNQVGLFAEPKGVFIFPPFINTLPARHIRAGFAEVIKHALIKDPQHWKQLVKTDLKNTATWDQLIVHSVLLKNEIVKADLFEKNIRKSLNFGHTIGHAIESFFMGTKKPLLHGEAVAAGIICESFLSTKLAGLNKRLLDDISTLIMKIFGKVEIPAGIDAKLIALMKQDKKNSMKKINFSLISDIGKTRLNVNAEAQLIKASLDNYRKLSAR